ncbi:MAG TPA: hypothetical protein VJ723_15510 [Candidatus Angelobacter sp.]|nr:hypothetical protein [Candidatus Angelobacter sp.]
MVSSQLCFVKGWRGILCALLTGAVIVLTTAEDAQRQKNVHGLRMKLRQTGRT